MSEALGQQAVVGPRPGPARRERYVGLGAEPETSSPGQFAAYLKKDIGSRAKVVKAVGAKAE